MFGRLIIFVGLGLLLSGCLTVPPHNLTSSEFQKYRIAEITVEGVEGIRSWPSEEDRFLKSHAVSPETANRIMSEPAFNFPELQAHLQKTLDAKFRSEIGYLAGPILSGSRPVRVVVRLRVFDIPSTARRVFVDNTAKMQADIDIVDKATGDLILRYAGRLETRKLIGGLATGIAVVFEGPDLGYSMITDYLSAYRNWLLRN